jgi:hypothetical protein
MLGKIEYICWMNTIKTYSKTKSIEQWVDLIKNKFSGISIEKLANTIIGELNITNEDEIYKINQAALIYFGGEKSILTFDDACVKLNVNPYHDLNLLTYLSDEIKNKHIAFYKLTIIVKALNEGWTPDWGDSNQPKYYNYFRMKGGFSYWLTHYYSTDTNVPSALCFKSEALAYYCCNMFLDLYKDYYL